MSTTTGSRLPTRLPTKSNNGVNGSSTGQQQKTPTLSKSQKGLVKKSSSNSINKSPNMLSSTTQPQITTAGNTQFSPSAATNVDQTKKLRPLKTNTDTTNKTSPVSSLLPSTKSSNSIPSITNDIKSSAKKNLAAQTVKQTSILKRKNDNTRTQPGAASSLNTRKSTNQTPKSISNNNTSRKKETSIQQQSRISTKNSTNLTTSTRNNEPRTGTVKLLAEIEKLRSENNKLQAENKALAQEKGDHIHYRSELDIANNLIMEQAVIMSDQQSLIEELMTQLDEQERVCQDLQNVIDTFKTKHNILDDVKFPWHPLDLTICTF